MMEKCSVGIRVGIVGKKVGNGEKRERRSGNGKEGSERANGWGGWSGSGVEWRMRGEGETDGEMGWRRGLGI